MNCRPGCGVCCIVPSISSAIPGMPNGKPANIACIHLTVDKHCSIFNHPDRPEICNNYKAEEMFCGDSHEEAYKRHSLLL